MVRPKDQGTRLPLSGKGLSLSGNRLPPRGIGALLHGKGFASRENEGALSGGESRFCGKRLALCGARVPNCRGGNSTPFKSMTRRRGLGVWEQVALMCSRTVA